MSFAAQFAVETISSISRATDKSASLMYTIAGYHRRRDDWDFQAKLATIFKIKQEIREQRIPKEILYTEWHLGTKTYIERLFLFRGSAGNIIGNRVYEESKGLTQIFEVNGFQGRGFYWLEYHRADGRGGGTIMLHDIGTGNFNVLITAGHCDTSALRCYKNRWVLVSHEQESIPYNANWLEKVGEIS